MWEETASKTRQFANEWNDANLAGEVYDSWGKLVVMRVLTASTATSDAEVEPQALTLAEAATETPSEFQERCRTALLDEFPLDDRPADEDTPTLTEAARTLDRAVKQYNSRKPSLDSQAAYTIGFRVIRQLAEGAERKFIRVQQGRAGTNSRLNQGALRLFARLFEQQSTDGHLRKFFRYLKRRGIALDEESREQVIQQLDQMSLLNKMSDSKEAIYVESI
jgi:DNA phosphorothioation-dependent restriction protein DptG